MKVKEMKQFFEQRYYTRFETKYVEVSEEEWEHLRKDIRKKDFMPLIIGMVFGVALGVTFMGLYFSLM